ncbi:unnamed protein product, partial [Meganyctiphanes norvegica]
STSSETEDGTGNRPHVIIIVADDLGWNDVSWHNPKINTPHLGDLANNGIILNQSYVMHICTPSRAALLTGHYPIHIGRQHSVIHPLEPTGLTMNATLMPEQFKKMGYSTHAVGKWHLGYCNWKYTPTKRGFDTFFGFYNGDEDYFTHARSWFLGEDGHDNQDVKPPPPSDVPYGYDFRYNTTAHFGMNGTYS